VVVLGKRNREIAVELGVSVKSVEWHVSHILRKLSITSRLDLADALAQPAGGEDAAAAQRVDDAQPDRVRQQLQRVHGPNDLIDATFLKDAKG